MSITTPPTAEKVILQQPRRETQRGKTCCAWIHVCLEFAWLNKKKVWIWFKLQAFVNCSFHVYVYKTTLLSAMTFSFVKLLWFSNFCVGVILPVWLVFEVFTLVNNSADDHMCMFCSVLDIWSFLSPSCGQSSEFQLLVLLLLPYFPARFHPHSFF